jgi:hypothetical protein
MDGTDLPGWMGDFMHHAKFVRLDDPSRMIACPKRGATARSLGPKDQHKLATNRTTYLQNGSTVPITKLSAGV